MSSLVLAAAGIAFVVALALTYCMRYMALAHGMIDTPNTRSSHVVPTPRGGGVSIVVATSLTIAWLAWVRIVDTDLACALLFGGVLVALVGFMDDRRSLSVRLRFAVHAGAAICALVALGGLPPLQFGERIVDLGLVGDTLGVLAIIWVLNLFNFMDGIDGIAGSEAAFIAICGGLLVACGSDSHGVAGSALVLGAASLGFLAWNWPPAKIFMGDVGSGYLGFVLAVLGIAAARSNPIAPFVWLILGGVFFVDATVTMLRRLARGEQVHVAHRTHAYQWLARRWSSHARVTIATNVVNLAWLCPWAIAAKVFPAAASWIVLAALAPLVWVIIAAGAGRADAGSNHHT